MQARVFRPVVGLVAALMFCAGAAPAHADETKPAYKWRIEFDHKAGNDGEVVFRIAPEGGTPTDVSTKIPAGTHENHAAKILRDSLKASLGKAYHIETDDGEDVLVKARGKTPKFVVTMVSSSLTGLQVEVKKD